MKTDRELLEAAAKAAGLTDKIIWWENRYIRDTGSAYAIIEWNPLTDDGDALRLAVALRIEIEPWIHGGSACARAAVGEILIDEPHYGDDPGRATRRAIVRTAAEMLAG